MTVGAYDAKKKERLYGILRQTPSVLSLTLIFFVALSAQLSAAKKDLGEKITVLCVGEISDKGSKDKTIPAATRSYLSYHVPTPVRRSSGTVYVNQLECGRTKPATEISDINIAVLCDIGGADLAAFESYQAAVKAKTFNGSMREYLKETGKNETKAALIDRIRSNFSLKHVIGDKEYLYKGECEKVKQKF